MAGFTAGLGAASAQVNAFGKQLSQDLGEAKSRDIERIGKASLVAGGALLAGFGLAARATLDFDKTLSDLQAVSGATGDQMDVLRQQALDAGAATVFSASEAAAAQVELAKAGVSTADILGGALNGALSLAAAGNLDLATAATYSANAMTTFGLSGRDVGHIADVLAAAANKSAVDVADIGLALQQTGLVADQFGLTLDDTVGVLAAFGQAGLKGSDAGTSFKSMLQRLGAPTGVAASEMERLGVNLFDAQGNFVGIEEAAGELKDGLSGLSQQQRIAALTTIFGADAVRAATILYEEGAEGIGGWIDQVNEAGYAEEVAATKTDNLAGDLEALGGALETQLIENGTKATGVLRELTQGVTSTVTGFGELPGVVQTAGVGLGGIAATGLTAIGVVGTLAPKVRELKTSLEGMGAGGQFVSRNMGAMTGALGLAGLAVTALAYSAGEQAQAQAEIAEGARKYTDAILEQGAAIGILTDKASALDLLEGDLGKSLRDAGADVEFLSRALQEHAGDLDGISDDWETFVQHGQSGGEALASALDAAGLSGTALADEMMRLEEAGVPIGSLVERVEVLSEKYRTGVRDAENQEAATEAVGDSAEGATEGVAGLEGGMEGLAGATEEAKSELEEYQDLLKAQFDPLFGMINASQGLRDAQVDVAEAQAALNDALASGNATEIAEAQRAYDDALTGSGEALVDVQAAQAILNDAVRNGGVQLDVAKDSLYRWAINAGFTADEAAAMAGQLDGASDSAIWLDAQNPHVSVSASDQASAAIDTVKQKLFGIDGMSASVHINIREVWNRVESSIFGRWGMVTEYAKGGIHEFAAGGVTPAHIARGDMIRYAEPETGGEAFIPRFGNYNRSKSILETAAGWHGLEVVPRGSMAGGDGPVTIINNSVSQTIDSELTAMDRIRLERTVERVFNRMMSSRTGAGV